MVVAVRSFSNFLRVMRLYGLVAATVRMVCLGGLGVRPLDFLILMAVGELGEGGCAEVMVWCGVGNRQCVYNGLWRLRGLGLVVSSGRSPRVRWGVSEEGRRVLEGRIGVISDG